MKVLHVINSLATGGAERLVVDMVTRLRSVGVDAEIAVLAPAVGFPADAAAAGGIPVHALAASRFDPRLAARLRQLSRRFDVVHAHLFPAFAWSAVAAACPVVLTEHSPTNSRRGTPLQHLERPLYRRCRRLIAISGGVRDALAGYLRVAPNSIEVIYNGVDTLAFRPVQRTLSPASRDRPMRALIVGTLDRRKNVGAAIRCLAGLDDVHLTVIGDGPERAHLETLAVSLSLSQRVSFLGWRSDVATLMGEADVLLSTSQYEGFGLAAVEGMATGLPVVAPAVPGLAEVVQDGVQGLLFPANDEASCTDRLARLACDAELRRRLGTAAMARAARFSIAETVDRHLELYMEVGA